MKKVKGIAQLKKEADKWCSLYVRQKGADLNGMNTCYTCGVKKHFKELQCGHYISRVYGNLRYYEPNLRPQCYSCNVMRHGNMAEYAIRLERETPGILEKLHQAKYLPPSSFKALDLLDLIEIYKQKIKEL
jgi:hypothetical protein